MLGIILITHKHKFQLSDKQTVFRKIAHFGYTNTFTCKFLKDPRVHSTQNQCLVKLSVCQVVLELHFITSTWLSSLQILIPKTGSGAGNITFHSEDQRIHLASLQCLPTFDS